MKNLKLFTAIVIALTMGLASCTKEGPVGPAGTAGTDGNANVTTIIYEDVDWVSGIPHVITIKDSVNLTADAITNDAIILYGITSSLTYPIPGPRGNSYFVRNYFSKSSTTCFIKAQDFDGSNYSGTPSNFQDIKMVFIKSNSNITAIKQLDNAGIDINDVEAVENFFGIE